MAKGSAEVVPMLNQVLRHEAISLA